MVGVFFFFISIIFSGIMAFKPDFFYGLTHNKYAVPMPPKLFKATKIIGIILLALFSFILTIILLFWFIL